MCEREKIQSEIFNKRPQHPIIVNCPFQVRIISDIYKVLLPELDPYDLFSHTTPLKNKISQLLFADEEGSSIFMNIH